MSLNWLWHWSGSGYVSRERSGTRHIGHCWVPWGARGHGTLGHPGEGNGAALCPSWRAASPPPRFRGSGDGEEPGATQRVALGG